MSPAVARLLAALEAHGCDPRTSGEGWAARCPAHEDGHPSLGIAEGGDGRALILCHAGCDTKDVLAALGTAWRDLFPDDPAGEGTPPTGARPARRATAQCSPAEPDHPALAPVADARAPSDGAQEQAMGLSLEEYARAKALPVEFLRRLGVTDGEWNGLPSVRIPYPDASGREVSVRFRVGLGGPDRFRWRRGSKALPYGLDRLAEAKRKGYVVLCEGESDAHTLWLMREPALGLPGAGTWKEERDAPALDGIPVVYVVVEPDRGGETLLARISKSTIRDRVRLIRLEHKDPSDLYLADPPNFPQSWKNALRSAVPWAQHVSQEASVRGAEAWQRCESLARQPRILDVFAQDLQAAGVAGEERNAKVLYLAITSRLFTRPVSVATKGVTSSGKSYLAEHVLVFFPSDVCINLSGLSERYLLYGDEDLSHKVLLITEAHGLGGFATYLVRTLLSEGRISYATVEDTPEGLRGRWIVREGPTGFIVTTTRVGLHPENETRLLSLTTADTQEQTHEILIAIAKGEPPALNVARWHAFQRWLEAGERRVVFPLGVPLAMLIRPLAVRLRRDFRTILSLIHAHALLHRAGRERDDQGRIVATIEDYAVVRDLVGDLVAEGIGASIPRIVRETVAAAARLLVHPLRELTQAQLAQALDLDAGTVSRRVAAAIKLGHLRNLEKGRGKPSRIVLGDPMPLDTGLLPSAQAVADMAERLQTGNGGANGGCNPEAPGNRPSGSPLHDCDGTGEVRPPDPVAPESREGAGPESGERS